MLHRPFAVSGFILLLRFLLLASCDDTDLKIPDPFGDDQDKQGYYRIESFQWAGSHGQSARLDVVEYFSLRTGLTFSIQSNKDDRSSDPLVIIVDGYRDKSYILKDLNANKIHWDKIECDIDHHHHNKQVFPWQYKYQTPKNLTSFIYGVGAIWLNAIKYQKTSNLVHFEPAVHPTKYSWTMRDRDIEVELMFDKSSDNVKVDSIHVVKKHSIIADGNQNTLSARIEKKDMYVGDFRYVERLSDDEKLLQLTDMVGTCRRFAKDHRAFPNLLAAVSSSPQRMFSIGYMRTRYPAAKSLKSDSSDDDHYGPVSDRQYITEWFSFQKEMSMKSYVNLDDTTSKKSSKQQEDQVDIFIKRFFDTVMTPNPAKPSIVTYHLIEKGEYLDSCHACHDEPHQTEPHMIRPVHFYSRARSKVSGSMSGMGALIMNAADSRHLKFNLYSKTIDIINDPANRDEKTMVPVNEWQLIDRHIGRTVRFYFRKPQDNKKTQRIQDLVRVDIYRDGESSNQTEFGLLYQYDIFNIETEVSSEELEIAFEVPQECFDSKPDHFDSDSESEADDSLDPNYIGDSDSDSEFSDENEDEPDHEDDFEFNPGYLDEQFEFPKLFSYMDGRAAYAIESEVEIDSKRFYLREKADLESAEAIIGVFEDAKSKEPTVEFHINYNTELIFKISYDGCILVEDIDAPDWLKTISSQLKYLRSISSESDSSKKFEELIESNKLRWFGVGAIWREASESEYTRLDGFSSIMEGNSSYKEIKWSLDEDGRPNSQVNFVFRYDFEQHKISHKLKKANRLTDFIQLKQIEFHEMVADETTITQVITIKSIDYSNSTAQESKDWELPVSCSGAIAEASKRLRTEYHQEDVTIPSLWTFIGQQRAYTVQYTVSHSPLGRSHDPSSLTGLPILETFDLDSRKGKLTIGVGVDRRVVFIDGTNSSIFAYSERTDECKRLGTLNDLVDFEGCLSSERGANNLDPNRVNLYGLGALWNRLARAQNGNLRIEYRIDERGFRKEIRTYRIVGSHFEAFTHLTEVVIIMIFTEDEQSKLPAPAEKPIKEKTFKLRSIDIIPKKVKGDSSRWKHATTIQVASLGSSFQDDWILPQACERQGRLANIEFPKLSEIISAKRQLYMRSELTSTRRINDKSKQKLTLVEEWIYEKNYRFNSLNLDQNYDLMIYGSTRESFDFRFPYQCSRNLWKSNERRQLNKEEQNNVLDFWSSDESSIERPSLIYFAPAALWLAAERDLSNVKLVSTIDLAPYPPKNNSPRHKNRSPSEREMRQVTWQVSSAADVRAAWSYKLFFEELSAIQSDGETRVWHILDRVELEETNPSTGTKFEIDLEVVNYNYELTQQEIVERFTLPEAHRCERGDSVKRTLLNASDELQFQPNFQHKITYKAHLKLTEPNEDSERFYSPISGTTYSTGHNLGDTIQVQSYHILSRSSDGTTMITKEVHDKFNSLVYSFNSFTGLCDIKHNQHYDWQLRFNPLERSSISPVIKLDYQLFELLFLNTDRLKFRPIDRWAGDNFHVSTYELDVDNLKLIEHFPRGQPATIVRRYFTYGRDPKLVQLDGWKFFQWNDIETKVYLFNADRNKVVGQFKITLNAHDGTSLAEIMRANSIEECYNNNQEQTNRRLGSYTLDFRIEEPRIFDWLNFDYAYSEQELLLKLIQKGNLFPTQFVEIPKIYLKERENSLMVDLQLLDAPTSVEYFKPQPHSNMVDDLLSLSEMRLLPDLDHCSRWCDKELCLAFSYCSGRICRILADVNLHKGNVSQIRERISSSLSDESCDYFYLGEFRPSGLDKFAQLVRSDLSRIPASSMFGVEQQYLMLSQLYEHTSDIAVKYVDSSSEVAGLTYMALSDHGIELDLDRIMKTFNTILFEQANNFADCLEKCANLSCPVVSYDADKSSCVIIRSQDELKSLLMTKSSERQSVSIAVRDQRDEYDRFEGTAMPSGYERKLEHYSAVECASACSKLKTGDGKLQGCLSFDHCQADYSVCFLQVTHVLSNSFDRSLLEPNLNRRKANVTCDHYSKSALADFVKLANKQMAAPTIAKEISVDETSCAFECRQDDQCSAFEYCLHKVGRTESKTCRVVLGDSDGPDREPSVSDSSSCSVYILKHHQERFDWSTDESGEIRLVFLDKMDQLIRKHVGSPRMLIKFILFIIVGIVVGLIIQLVLIKLSGRSILFAY